jgi:hypothetical protein
MVHYLDDTRTKAKFQQEFGSLKDDTELEGANARATKKIRLNLTLGLTQKLNDEIAEVRRSVDPSSPVPSASDSYVHPSNLSSQPDIPDLSDVEPKPLSGKYSLLVNAQAAYIDFIVDEKIILYTMAQISI